MSEAHLSMVLPAPRTPGAQAQRWLLRFSLGEKAMLLVGSILLIFLAMALPFAWDLPVDFALDLSGRKVEGHITHISIDRHVKVNGVSPLLIHYAYDVGGTTYNGSSDAERDGRYADAVDGQLIEVLVVPARPTWSRLDGESASFIGYFGLIPSVFPLSGLVLLVLAVRGRDRRRATYRRGEPVLGRVVEVRRDASVRINGRNPPRLRWGYKTPDGKSYEGSLLLDFESPLAAYKANEPLTVLYLPERPQRSVPYLSD